jgi:hypothetical protein
MKLTLTQKEILLELYVVSESDISKKNSAVSFFSVLLNRCSKRTHLFLPAPVCSVFCSLRI